MISISNLEFSYREGGFSLRVPELSIDGGATVAVIGPSGTGKTTLLNLIAGILIPESGSVTLHDTTVSGLGDAARRDFRIQNIGLVFQEFELLSYLDILDNILLPYRIAPVLTLDAAVRDRARALAHSVGIGDKLHRHVGLLSQGERQRVAICRALLVQPQLLLADEPTGNLDPSNKGRVLDILFDYVSKSGATMITVTHDHDLLSRYVRVIDFDEIYTGGTSPEAQS